MPYVRPRADGCLSDLALDRLLDGELAGTPAERAARAHLGGCADCRGRQAQLQAAPAQAPDPVWLAVHAPEPVAEPVPLPPVRWDASRPAAGPGARQPWWSRMAVPTLAAAGMAAVLVLITRPWAGSPSASPPTGAEVSAPDVTRIKGHALALEIFVRRADGRTEPVSSEMMLRARDEIGFVVRASEPGYLVVVGLDAEGKVSLYAPAEPGGALAVTERGSRVLERSVILDDSRGDEKVMAVLCPSEAVAAGAAGVARAALLAAGGAPSRVARLDLPCVQAQATFRKGPPA